MRPVVSQIGHPTHQLARIVDKNFFQPMLKRMEHLLRSTDHLLSIIPTLKFASPDHIVIITLDVKSLYTSIPLKKGLSDTLKWLFKSSPQKYHPIIREFISGSLELILFNNLFEFGEKAFRQVKGVAMGSPIGPSFANTYLLNVDNVISHTPGILKYFRYIDDVLIFADSSLLKPSFFADINAIDRNIQFDQPVTGKSVDYLDLSLTISPSGRVEYCTYEKNIASFTRYIHYNSFHSLPLKSGIIIGQAKRILKTCSSLFFVDQPHQHRLVQTSA